MTMPKPYSRTNVLLFAEETKNNLHHNQQSVAAGVAAPVSSSTTTMQTLPSFDRFARQNMALERLKTEFADAFGREMPRAIAQQVLRDLRSGTPAAYYSYAIAQTMYAPRPSWRYTMAIMARLQRTMASEDDMDFREGR